MTPWLVSPDSGHSDKSVITFEARHPYIKVCRVFRDRGTPQTSPVLNRHLCWQRLTCSNRGRVKPRVCVSGSFPSGTLWNQNLFQSGQGNRICGECACVDTTAGRSRYWQRNVQISGRDGGYGVIH
jgi:hypothetical protein